MASVFWDAKSIVFVDHLQKGKNYQWKILCQIAKEATTSNQVKAAWKADKRCPASSGQCSCSLVFDCNVRCA